MNLIFKQGPEQGEVRWDTTLVLQTTGSANSTSRGTKNSNKHPNSTSRETKAHLILWGPPQKLKRAKQPTCLVGKPLGCVFFQDSHPPKMVALPFLQDLPRKVIVHQDKNCHLPLGPLVWPRAVRPSVRYAPKGGQRNGPGKGQAVLEH